LDISWPISPVRYAESCAAEHRDDQQAAPIAPTRFTYISTAAPFRHSCQIAKLLTSGDLIEDRDHHPEI
jgi:hypothetical protein